MPSFTVEASAEVAPLDLQTLAATLQRGHSGSPVQIQSATKQLQAWETTPGYHTLLQDVYLQRSISQNTRMLAVIALKNGVDKYWRKSANNALRPEEKTAIRSRLVQVSLDELSNQIMLQNAVIIAKVARFDFPDTWPTLIGELCDTLRASATDYERLNRVMRLTKSVAKEFCTVRIQRSKAALHTAMPELFSVLFNLFDSSVSSFWSSSDTGRMVPRGSIKLLLIAGNSVRIIRRVLLSGYAEPHKAPEVVQCWNIMRAQLAMSLQSLQTHPEVAGLIIPISKVFVMLANDRPNSFALLPDTPTIVHTFFQTAVTFRQHQVVGMPDSAEQENLYQHYEAFNLRALHLIRACFKMIYGRATSLKVGTGEESKHAKDLMASSVLTPAFIHQVFEGIRNYFFVLQDADIEEWFNEAEEWEMKEQEEQDLAEHEVRAAAEKVFLDIVINHKDAVVDPIAERVTTLLNQAESVDMRQLDAALTEIAVAASALQGRFDFNSLLSRYMLAEVKRPREDAHIIRRKIAVVLAVWSPIDIAEENKDTVYKIYHFLLDPSQNSSAVRIAAGRHLQEAVSAFGFDIEIFAPYGADTIKFLVTLIQEVSLIETKMALVATLNAVVERMDTRMSDLANDIVTLLPSLWQEAEDESLLMQRLVELLTSLINALKALSVPLHAHVLPIIHDTLDPTSDKHIALMEDSLAMLYGVVIHTQAPASEEMLQLLPMLLPILDHDTENITQTLAIIDEFLILAPDVIMSNDQMRRALVSALVPGLTSKKTPQITGSAQAILSIIRSAETLGGSQGVSTISQELGSQQLGGLLSLAKTCIITQWHRTQSSGPNQQEPPSDWRAETHYFDIISRLILGRTECFAEFVGNQADGVKVLEEWFAHMDQVNDPMERKLQCMALTKLLETGSEMILGKLQDLFSLWTSIVIDLRDEHKEVENNDSLVVEFDLGDMTSDSASELRRMKFEHDDLVRKVQIAEYIKHYLNMAVAVCGGQEAFQAQWLVNVDADVVKSFSQLNII